MLRELFTELGIPDDYGRDGLKPAFEEAVDLVDIGPNPDGRMQRLTSATAASWQAMQAAARDDGITLLPISGFRSIAYQAGLIRRKLDAGQSVSDILIVNAAPGFSEHHTGRAVDIAVPGAAPLTEEFESSAAFAWLEKNAATFGFSMSYPRENRQGFVYEPWHWAKMAE
jgi:D-alanyl-D-alanine carboxypeptidase